MTKKKVEDYFTDGAVTTPHDMGGPINGVQITPMQHQLVPQVSAYQNGVQIPQGAGHPVSNPYLNLDKQMALQLADQRARAIDKFKEPAATTAYTPDIPRPTSGSIEPFDPAFVDLTRPTTGPSTRPIHYPPQQQGNILVDPVGNPVMSGGNPVGLPTQNVPKGATGGGKGAGGK
jgi:hypothetical protein